MLIIKRFHLIKQKRIFVSKVYSIYKKQIKDLKINSKNKVIKLLNIIP